ncbi:Wings apart-like protein [Parasponia andersonii]|uniref:Wings apart-like protein n=1 Tax=Parasponia andersonii TaxID=3476 RepID=A0A2P5AJU9_PARAD|nr:Wings apart-like protein [Parasponia andersonii]
MIVRTYGRRNRGIPRTYSDGLNDAVNDDEDPFTDSLSQEASHSRQDQLYSLPFSSQDSSSHWSGSAFDFDPYGLDSSQGSLSGLPTKASFDESLNGGVIRKPKKARIEKRELVGLPKPPKAKSSSSSRPLSIPATSTLMEAQEFGEMMEHVDEVNFAIDGLRRNQQVRIRRASLLSLLSICGTAHQRRLLRTQGMAKTIIDAVLGLSFDDSPSNLGAACLLYVLTSDGQDDHLLESPSCFRFLIRLLKPILSTSTEEKVPKIGCKLLALRTGADILQNTKKKLDSSSAAIFSKVHEILVSCKEMKSSPGDDSGVEKPELCPKWIALLTMEKACISTISLEETTGTVRKTGGNFKEKLRELGGLDAVFEVAMNCHSDMENHLLGMRRSIYSTATPLSFTQLVMSVIKILSDLYLLKTSAVASTNEKSSALFDETGHAFEFALTADCEGDDNEALFFDPIKSSSEEIYSDKSFNISQNSQFLSSARLERYSSETTSTSMNDACLLKTRLKSSASSSCSGTSRSLVGGMQGIKNGSRKNPDIVRGFYNTKDVKPELLEESQDPFAFDEDDFEPSKWEVLYGKQTKPRTKRRGVMYRELEDDCLTRIIMSQQESSNGETNQVHEASCSSAVDKEGSSLLADCLLTAVKVLMNLTNDNPTGCHQIAACGGLETMTSLIAGHFPSFGSSSSPSKEIKENASFVDLDNQNDRHLTDQELDFLVAILGLLVNLVEKDGENRSRLASASVQLHNWEGFEDLTSKDVIPLLCSIFLANQGAGEVAQEGNCSPGNDEAADPVVQGEKEAEKMIVEAYSALLLAFLSTESKRIRDAIADCLPDRRLAVLVPVLDRFVAFHLSLNMISPETHKAVSEVIESCRIP